MMPEKEIHKLLAKFGVSILALLDSIDFFEIEGPYNPVEVYASIPPSIKKEYLQESKAKNIEVYSIVGQVFALYGIYTGINQIRSSYPARIKQLESKKDAPVKALSAKEYQTQFINEHGGEFITNMSKTDQKKLTQFLWQNAGRNERPLARSILKTQPQLAYLVDNKEWRLRMIKRTEINRAKNYGSLMYAIDCDFETKRWNTAGDRRVRPSHRANAGITIPIKDTFPNGENYPGEISINCRCNLAYDLEKNKLTKNPSAAYDDNLRNIGVD